MKRNLVLVGVALVVVAVAILILRRGPQSTPTSLSPFGVVAGEFSNDSLGVLSVRLPPQRRWQMRRDPAMPGGSLLTAEHADGTASWKLFVTPADKVNSLEEVIRRRRDQLASLFGVTDLDQVVGRVLGEDVQERDGYPAVQWQAITQPVDVAGAEPIHVIFMWVATLRENYAYEGVGLLRFPVSTSQAQSAVSDSLLDDMVFMMETMRFQ